MIPAQILGFNYIEHEEMKCLQNSVVLDVPPLRKLFTMP